jgi:hypothetical protein
MIGAMMKRKAHSPKWIAVRIKIGFPVETRGYCRRSEAVKQERKWRKDINLDYDETGVLPLIIDESCYH